MGNIAFYLLMILYLIRLFKDEPREINIQHVTFKFNGKVFHGIMDNKHPDGTLLWLLYRHNRGIKYTYINYYGTKVLVLFYPQEPLVSDMEEHIELHDEFIREITNSFNPSSPWVWGGPELDLLAFPAP